MRRALLAAAIAVPLIALAITASDGQVLDTTNFSSTHGNISFVNADQCSGKDSLHLEWRITALQGSAFGVNDQVKIFASDLNPADSNNNGFCDEKEATTPKTVHAGPIGTPLQPATTLLADRDVPHAGADIKGATTIDCATAEGTNVFICAHWYDSAGTTKKGLAVGTFQIQTARPDAPVAPLEVNAGDGKLFVSWTAPAGGAAVDHYVAEAYAPGQSPANPAPDNVPASTATVTATSAEIRGLANGTPYDVYVRAFSVGGNASDLRLGPVKGTPAAAANFFDVYKDRGGSEAGGCGSGSAGVLALLGAASLLALRRRRP
ncbi:MAG TPA: fibronectin type III domain-containing protein [Anaeromyxobacter sp.]